MATKAQEEAIHAVLVALRAWRLAYYNARAFDEADPTVPMTPAHSAAVDALGDADVALLQACAAMDDALSPLRRARHPRVASGAVR